MVCGFSCEDLISMFKELKSLGVVVKELSNELRQLVREESRRLLAGCMRLPVCPSLRVSVGQLLPCAVSACVCTCPTQSQTHTEFSAVNGFSNVAPSHTENRQMDKAAWRGGLEIIYFTLSLNLV